MKLNDVLRYWEHNRGRGHTRAALEGVEAQVQQGGGGVIYVMRHSQDRLEAQRRLGLGAIVLTVDDDGNRLRGLTKPLVVDHDAMAHLVHYHDKALRNELRDHYRNMSVPDEA